MTRLYSFSCAMLRSCKVLQAFPFDRIFNPSSHGSVGWLHRIEACCKCKFCWGSLCCLYGLLQVKGAANWGARFQVFFLLHVAGELQGSALRRKKTFASLL